MKRIICLFVTTILLLSVGCAPQSTEPIGTQIDAPTTEPATIDPELLPDVFDDASAFFEAGNIDIAAPQGATEVTQIILFDEICQVQFMFGDVFFTYRAAFASTGRTGYDLTGIVETLEYQDSESDAAYTNDSVDTIFEVHLLDNGALLLWNDDEINYSLASYGGTFEDLSAVADLILK